MSSLYKHVRLIVSLYDLPDIGRAYIPNSSSFSVLVWPFFTRVGCESFSHTFSVPDSVVSEPAIDWNRLRLFTGRSNNDLEFMLPVCGILMRRCFMFSISNIIFYQRKLRRQRYSNKSLKGMRFINCHG
jgi:hypothetical protein